MALFKEIDSATLNTLRASQSVDLVDVRSDDEVARGMIMGARHIPLHMLPLRVEEFEGENPVVFYCHSGIRSAQACSFMAQQGRENLFNLRGGILAWGTAGLPIEPKK